MLCPNCDQRNGSDARFCSSCGSSLASPLTIDREVRRTVTVLFIDVVGSTSLGERHDAESVRRALTEYFSIVRRIVTQHGGTIEKFIGDAVMAVFGFPVQREDDALRAVRAAVAARAALQPGTPVATIRFGKARDIALRGRSGQVRVHPVSEVLRDASGIVRHLAVPLVGRELELSLIAGALELSRRAGRPGLFTLLGPAGIGKTRLSSEFLSSVKGTTVIQARARHDQAEAGSLIAQLRRQARAASNADAVGSALASDSVLDELAAHQPLVVAVDDLQSADARTLDWLERLAVHARGPVFVLAIARPELLEDRPAWGRGMLSATSLTLGGLDADSLREIGRQILGDLPPIPVWGQIAAASEGNPLYLEHVLADLVDRGLLADGPADWRATRAPSHIGTPSSISALIGARLDRLPAPQRIALECAAVIGTAFGDALLAELVPSALADGLERTMAELIRKQWIRPSGAGGAFEFTSSTVRDAAYGRLSKASRVDLHERAGVVIEHTHQRSAGGLDATQHFDRAAAYRLEVGLAPRDSGVR